MAWTTPRTWTASEVVTSSIMNTHVRDNLNALTTWTSYTPTWAATGGTPTIGDGTLTGEYIEAGELCHARVRLTIGSSTTIAGTTAWNFSLPFTSVGAAAGSVLVYDASAAMSAGTAMIQSGAAIMFAHIQGTGLVGNAIPMGWVNTDYMQLSVTYRVA